MRKPVFAICDQQSLISAFAVRVLDSIIPILANLKFQERAWCSGWRASPAVLGSLVRSLAPPVFQVRL